MIKKILISSAKGGVGKSTISTSVARILNNLGYKVGILDIDIDAPNIPEFMEIEDRDIKLSDEGIIPKLVEGIEIMSIGLIADTDKAVMWDGVRRSMAIEQMISHVDWTCHVLIIDSPPGTTEEISTLISKFTPDGIFIVTTNHKASISDTKRELAMIRELAKVNKFNAEDKILGIIKNMTYYICECGVKTNLFSETDDEEINRLTVAEVPYINSSVSDINEYLVPVIEKIERVI